MKRSGRIARRWILIGTALLLTILGDLFNLPLWPMDYLRTRIPVEIRCRLDGVDESVSDALIQEAGGVAVTIESSGKSGGVTLLSDPSGIVRLVLPVGRVRVSAQLSAEHQGRHYLFTTMSPGNAQTRDSGPNTIAFSREKEAQELVLFENMNVSSEIVSKGFQRYLMNGAWDSAAILAEKLGEKEKTDIELLVKVRLELEALPIAAYNSRIRCLERLREIASAYLEDPGAMLIGRTLVDSRIDSSLAALRAARDSVIRKNVSMMLGYLDAENLKAMLEIWMQFEKNPELDPGPGTEWDLLPTEVRDITPRIPEIKEAVLKELEEMFISACGMYARGDFSESRTLFAELLSWIGNLELTDEFKDMMLDTRTYLDDIALLSLANDLVRSGHVHEALDALDLVFNVTDLVRGQIADIQELVLLKRDASVGGKQD